MGQDFGMKFFTDHRNTSIGKRSGRVAVRRRGNTTAKPSVKGVIIKVYVELPTSHSRRQDDSIKRLKRSSNSWNPRTEGSSGYDRRAQLLAHVRELRNSISQQG
ncbi:hypothetical protein Nepgr_019269 [Nepenthes gracilis]|uniref:Uncharacterized protein n=1 Tax=Nepenthes gracilis TaxID=150966 RepID=A0AAD3XU76_NEPGR|nr:hypothetical protein Nepgr_019269 [Nepenthes gracilis]